MKNLFKRFTAVIAAVFIFCLSVFPSSVSASSYAFPNSPSNTSSPFSGSLDSTYYNSLNSKVSSKLGFSLEDCIFICSFDSNNGSMLFFIPLESSVSFSVSNDSSGDSFYVVDLSDPIVCYNKNLVPYSNLYKKILISTKFDSSPSSYIPIKYYYFSDSDYYVSTSNERIFTNLFSPLNFSTIEPDYSCFPLGIDIEGFVKYLDISQQKERIYKEYDSEVLDFIYSDNGLVYTPVITYYNAYGRSESPFFSHAQELYGITDFIKSDFDDVTLKNHLVFLHSVIKKLYSDYQKSKLMLLPDHEPNISTDDTLVTDVEDDTTDVSLLREIIRLLIKISNTLTNGFFDLVHKDFDISGDVDRIVTAINNIELKSPEGDVTSGSLGDVIVDVTITDEKQQELDDFFNGWSVDFDNKVKEKFPVTAQLGELFNDDFFEKCGIDCNGDGEVYSYYSENVYAVSETSTVSELSASAPGSDHKLVTDFLGQFDSADVNFLNDANFSSSVPDWSITVGGKKCEVFSFKLYAKYRTQIHFIMSFILWTVYLLSLYKSLPQIIGQVSDVVHGIEKM